MKKILIITVLNLFTLTAWANFVPTVPQETMQIAQEAQMMESLAKPKSQIVRVGIGDSNFKSYDYSEINIFGTAKTVIYENNLEVETFLPNEIIQIKYCSDMFVIYKNGEVIEQISGPVRIACKDGQLGIKDLKRSGLQALYRGQIELIKCDKKMGRFHVVNVIEVEDYLKGVVPNEMPVRFGLEALKAQSVAARNYVLSPRTKAHSAFDVVDSVASQVYFGFNTEKPLATKAVEETEGIVALYNWDLIPAQYSSTAGGYSESFANAFSDPSTKQFPSISKPYLIAKPDMLSQVPLNNEEDASNFYKSKPDSYDVKSPYYRWQRIWTKDELQKAIQQNLAAQSATGFVKPAFKSGEKLDDIVKLDVKRRGESGKIIELEIVTKTQTYKVYKELVIRRLLTNQGKALPSANIVFEHEYDNSGNLLSVKGFGGGFGHGVGMSQFGAGFMATDLKMSFDKILKHYYTGITLATKPEIISFDKPALCQTFYTKNNHTELIIDNKYNLSYFLVNINGKEQKVELSNNLFKRVERIDISPYVKTGKNTIIFYYPQEEGKNKGLRLFVEVMAKDE